jgi:cytochrome c5
MHHSNPTAVTLALVAVLFLSSAPTMAKKKIVAPPASEPLTVQLPDSNDVMPDLPNAEVVDRNCLSCHSVEMVENQPALPRAAWAAEIEKMRTVFKAPIDPGDVDAMLDYLTRLHGESRRGWR